MLPPYRMKFLNELAKSVDLTLVLDSLSEPGRSWELDLGEMPEVKVEVLNSKAVSFVHGTEEAGFSEKRVRQMSWGVWKILQATEPDCVVSTEFGLRSLLSAFWCKLNRVPLVIWWEGTLHTEREQSKKRTMLRKSLARMSSRFWSNGLSSQAYLQSLGVEESQIDNGMTGIDTQFFLSRSQSSREAREQTRQEFGFRGKTLLFSGALAPRKGIREFIEAIDALYRSGFQEELTIAFAGEGEEREFLERWQPVSDQVHLKLVGFLQLEELPKFYTAGDLFVLPTLEDNWALATLEPLICRLPSLVSQQNGAHADLKGEGVIIFKPGDVEGFVAALIEGLAQATPLSEARAHELADYYQSSEHAGRALLSIKSAVKNFKEQQ